MAQVGEMLRAARMNQGMTQEQAVQILPYDLRTLQAYELDERKATPWQAIAVIGQIYGGKKLLFDALQQNEVWQLCMPQISTDKSITEAGCTMLDELLEMGRFHQSILHIIRDGAVSPNEQEAWATAKTRMYALLASIITLLISDGTMDDELLREMEQGRST